MQLNVKYQTGSIFKSLHPGLFGIYVVVLPSQPVQSASLTTQVTSQTTATKALTEPPGAGHGGPVAGGNSYDCNQHDWPDTFHADQGWTIDQGSVNAVTVEEMNANAVALTLNDISSPGGTLQYTTYPRCINYVFGRGCNGCGEIYFYVAYVEERQVPVAKATTIPISLGWGDQIVEPAASGWTLQVSLFNGQTVECAAATPCRAPHGYISGSYNGSTLTLTTIDPTTLLAQYRRYRGCC